jgi:hypothetical protein
MRTEVFTIINVQSAGQLMLSVIFYISCKTATEQHKTQQKYILEAQKSFGPMTHFAK